tara:strand:- start:166 stop:663 length:498 start_codon:yes stop_codon:yes gene_type:complete
VIKFFKILTISIYFFLNNINAHAVEVLDKGSETLEKIKTESKGVLKKLIKTSLKDKEINAFLLEYVITIDDERGDGIVTYYFEDKVYKRYKDLKLISEDKWKVSYLDKKLKIYYGKEKSTWKIQPAGESTIDIKTKLSLLGKLHRFSYPYKTDFHVLLEEKKLSK